MQRFHSHSYRGLTLVELMIVLAIVAVLAVLAAPSFRDMILMQRLRAINSQLVTDLQYARSEAVQRKTAVRLFFKSDSSSTCYAIYTSPTNSGTSRCDCLLGPGEACTAANTREIRTVVIPRDLGVTVLPPSGEVEAFAFDPITGGLMSIPSDSASTPLGAALLEIKVDDSRRLRTGLNQAGRPTVCAPNAGVMQVSACS